MERKIKKRKDCFWGLHGDFHAYPAKGLVIGEGLRESDVRELCETLKPDFIQVDSKGHPGWASYPSKMGNAMPAFAQDPLALWRKVTREYGIALFVHYSSVVDIKYCEEHPEDRVLPADGGFSSSVRLDGRYVDEFMIPQLSEMVENYQVDGVWIDGDCWGARPDYRQETLAKFEAETGIDLQGRAPKSPEDPYYREYLDYTRELFRRYLRHYVDALHRKYPDLEICSNWAFSDIMPEGVSAGVDFLSGDLDPSDSVESARYCGRMLAQHGMPWDLMSWNFRYRVYGTQTFPGKEPVQIMQEAAAVIAQGGSYQDNIHFQPDGAPNMFQFRRLRPVAEFVLARQPFCHGGKLVRQAALFVSSTDRFAEMQGPYSREGVERLRATTALLCDSGLPLEIAGESALKGRYGEWPLILIPELYAGIGKTETDELAQYVRDGGSLLLVGARASLKFAEAGFPFRAERHTELPEMATWEDNDVADDPEAFAEKMPCYFSLDGEDFGLTAGACRIIPENGGAKTVASIYSAFREKQGEPFAVVIPWGRGKVGVIGADLGEQYRTGKQVLQRKLIRAMADELFDPLARIESADGILELDCLEKDGRLMLQLLNANGGHGESRCVTEDWIPPTENAVLSLRADAAPRKLILQPEGKELSFAEENGRIRFRVDRVGIHEIVEVVR